MVGRRTYGEGCAVSHALDVIGERWALVVVRELLLGPKRFTDLRAGMPGASPDVLAQRLRQLQEAGVVHQHKLPPPAASQVYALTDWGAELEPVITHLGRWGSRSPSMPYDADRSIDSLVLSFKALFDHTAAQGFSATITLPSPRREPLQHQDCRQPTPPDPRRRRTGRRKTGNRPTDPGRAALSPSYPR